MPLTKVGWRLRERLEKNTEHCEMLYSMLMRTKIRRIRKVKLL